MPKPARKPVEIVNPDKVRRRLYAKVAWDDHGAGCHEWASPSFRGPPPGYPSIWMNGRGGRVVYAHIVACLLAGKVCPPELEHDHICHNHACVNPDHIRFVTERVNSLENNESPHARNARKTHCVHGHEYTPTNTAVKLGGPDYRPARVCIACYPTAWRYCVVEIPPQTRSKAGWVGPQGART